MTKDFPKKLVFEAEEYNEKDMSTGKVNNYVRYRLNKPISDMNYLIVLQKKKDGSDKWSVRKDMK